MPRPEKVLDSISLVDVTTYLNPPMPLLSMQSPARLFMTDFLHVHPMVVSENAPVNEALKQMKASYVRMLMVTENGEHNFLGAVTATDLNGPKVLAAMASYEFSSREEVMVKHVMLDKSHIHGFDFRQVEHSTIGDVLATIKNLSEQHVMVVEPQGDTLVVRGIFSTTNIAKALHIQFDVEPQARTFFELQQVILHHRL